MTSPDPVPPELPQPSIRVATNEDIPAVATLVEASIRGLGEKFYNERQMAASLEHLYGVDTNLIHDGTYFLAESEEDVLAAGGWSFRRTPFGGDQATVQDAGRRDPATEPAVIRAFYVHPKATRRGLGRRILEACEAAAREEGFRHLELVSTEMGRPFYAALGFVAEEPVDIELPDDVHIPATRMSRPIGAAGSL